MTAQPYPVCRGLGGGDRANSVQKQSHFKSRTYASHSSKKWLQLRQKTYACKHCCSQTEYLQLLLCQCRAERPLHAPLHAPPPLRFNKARCWRNWLPSVPLAVTAVTQAVPPAQALCLGLLGVAWSPRPDPCAQRDGRTVERIATGFAD